MKPAIICGISIPIEISDDDDEPELGDANKAVYVVEEGRIVITDTASQEVRWHLLCHEMCHAGNNLMSVEHNLRRLGLTDKQADQVEEYIAELFPLHVANLEANGWIKRPLIK